MGDQFAEKRYGSRALLTVRNSQGKMGMITETSRVILPFEYSDIVENGNYHVLYKGSKMGFLILNTPYPHIDATFEEFYDYHAIPVNDYWSFGLFYVSRNGKDGYVGENGVEFFKN